MAQTTFSNGWVFTTFPPPPVGFDIDRASDGELANFGIPRFPPNSKTRRRFRHLARHGGFVEPVFTAREIKRTGADPFGQAPPPAPGAGNLGPWAGAMVFPSGIGTPQADKIVFVEGTWSIPETTPGSTTSGWTNILIGLDGWLETGGLAAGVLLEIDEGSVGQIIAGCFWLPDWTDVPVIAHPSSLAVGDELHCFIWYLGFAGGFLGMTGAVVGMENITQGWAAYWQGTPPSDALPFQGTSAEWLVAEWADWADFVGFTPPVTFLDCLAFTGSGAEIASASADTTNVIDANGKTVLEASLPASNRVQVGFV